jgi:chromosome segregation protein
LAPVHLKSIKIRGFKSFPDPVEIRLEPGVAVVVGPNGSGKSNVADALLWAAGSQSPRELRAERADDVLFAGAKGRPPAGSCEVELVFDNEDGALAELDFAEVSVARRLHRGGEGQYLVNRAAVRRLDLVELLADAGLGGGFRAVVSQGRVEEILASRPEERRALVEEAAGLGRFKLRRHRAELKLARVQAQAERSRDVEQEVRARLRPLALQATAAERAERLGGEIMSLHARVAELDVEALDARLAEVEDARLAATLARRRVDGALGATLAERDAAEEELADAAGGRERATASLYRFRSAVERLELRREAAEALELRLRSEVDEAAAAPNREVLDTAAREAQETAQAADLERIEFARRARELYGRLAGAERALVVRAEANLAAAVAERRGAEEGLALAAQARDRLYALRAAGERVELRRESVAALLARLRAELAQAEAAEGLSPVDLRRTADEAAAAARAAVRARDELAERAQLARDRLVALDSALAEREGIPPAARALAEAGQTLALQLIDVEPGHERAVAAALGPRASAILAGNAGAALALVEQAAASGLGTLRVLIGHDPAELVRELPIVPKERLLASRGPAVTVEGYGYDPGRGELWFAGAAAEAVQLELQARRRALEVEAGKLDRAAARADENAERAQRVEAEAEAQLEAVPPELRRPLPAPAVAARLVGGAERLDAALLAGAALARSIGRSLGTKAPAWAPVGELADAESVCRHEVQDAAARAAAAEAEVVRLGGTPGGPAAGDADSLRAAAVSAGSELAAVEARAAQAAETARRAVADRDAVGGRSANRDLLLRVADAAGKLPAILAAAAASAARVEGPLRARVDAGTSRTGEVAADLRRLAEREAELRREAGGAAERAAAAEVAFATIGSSLADARRRVADLGAEPAQGENRDELVERVERLERRRESLGQVNPLAKADYERERERLDELRLQREDLERSLEELEHLRAELAETVEQRFTETLDSIAETFSEVAATLFPGGEGRLSLVEQTGEDGGEAGIEVELRPAGKRVTRLSLLSGGEKALGAIAFLFALFLARPCPFYLLDEVEAALDDANIGRFVALLRRYADQAQFIVVTHQKRTMEAADLLYGVTMGADGVSEVVSRRMSRARDAVTA